MHHRIGGHLSTSQGYVSALESIVEKGGNALQIFSTSPLMWKAAVVSDTTAADFKKRKAELGVNPVYFHASYLINLADNDRVGAVSRKALVSELTLQPRMGVKGSVVHLGSYKDKDSTFDGLFEHERFPTLISNIKEILAETPEDSIFLIENAASRKIGQKLEEIAQIMNAVQNKRVRICLDTCHLHAAGYDLSTPENFELFINGFADLIGLENLELIHLNDSRDTFGSLRDRHENLLQGTISEAVFKQFLNDNRTRLLPFILETPGFDKSGPDKKNIDIAKSLIQK
jgi:deoxyribonuclease-4